MRKLIATAASAGFLATAIVGFCAMPAAADGPPPVIDHPCPIEDPPVIPDLIAPLCSPHPV